MSQDRMQTDALAQDQPDFMAAAMKMDNELHDEDVESMKFLCQGLVVGSKLKRVETVHELISLLQNTNSVRQNDLFLLADLLQYIGRIDVLEQISFEEREVLFRRQQQGSSIKPFYVLLFQIGEELAMEDVRKAAFAYGKVPRSHNVSSGLDLFTVMVQHKAVDPQNVGLLKSIFNTLERLDLVELVDRYIGTNGQSVLDDLEENFRRAMSFRGQDLGNLIPAPSQAPHGRRFRSGQGPSVHDMDVSDKRPTVCASELDSMANQTPSVPRSDPSAPPPSLHSMGQGVPSFQPAGQNSNATQTQSLNHRIPVVSEAPDGYDQFVIPWNVLDILSRNIPDEFWPELSYFLGAPLQGDSSRRKLSRFHRLAVLKRWLELPETRAMDERSTKIFLLKALVQAGPTLMAQEIAEEMDINMNDVMQESTSTQASGYDTNDVASSASAAHVNVNMVNVVMDNLQQRPTRSRGVEAASSPVPLYRMTSKPRGFCVIINNRDFYLDPQRPYEAKKMINREGTDVDRDKLVETFTNLKFETVVEENLTDTQLVQVIGNVSMADHSRYDCFVCCILTHGVQGALYGVNGITVPIRDMTSPLRAQACPSLAGKPKLFFLQACQGREKQEAHPDIQRDCEMEEDAPPLELIPNESDFLLGYATVPGFVSYRSKTRGSWYITKLTEMLKKYAEDHDILDILTLVNFEVGKGDALIDGGHYKQSPAPMYSLRKKLIFGRV